MNTSSITLHARGPLRARSALLPTLMLAATTALAQQAPTNFIALGAISTPEFEGSSDTVVRPFLTGRIGLGEHGSLRLTGLGVQYNLSGDGSPWAFGPMVSLRPARDADVEDEVVRRLREVKSTAEAGAFVQYSFLGVAQTGDRLALGVEAVSGKGAQFHLTAGYQGPKLGAFQYGVDARVTMANGKYMDTYFSVDADNSARSGLPQYAAGSGAKSASIGFTASYDLTPRWTLVGRIGYSRLLGDARDSPIVQVRGQSSGTSAGLALGYRF